LPWRMLLGKRMNSWRRLQHLEYLKAAMPCRLRKALVKPSNSCNMMCLLAVMAQKMLGNLCFHTFVNLFILQTDILLTTLICNARIPVLHKQRVSFKLATSRSSCS
jgi:hypothetical protein